MAGADRPGRTIGDPELFKQRLDAWMHRLAGPVAAGPLALA